MIAFRGRHPWLVSARIRTVGLTNTAVLLVAEGNEGQTARLALNLGEETATVGRVEITPHAWALHD